jgi:hypothetical protein
VGTEPTFLQSPSDLSDFNPAIRGSNAIAGPTPASLGLGRAPKSAAPAEHPGFSRASFFARRTDPKQSRSPRGVGAHVKGHDQAECGWAEHRPYVGDPLECRADYGGRFQRSIEGEIAPRSALLRRGSERPEGVGHLFRHPV